MLYQTKYSLAPCKFRAHAQYENRIGTWLKFNFQTRESSKLACLDRQSETCPDSRYNGNKRSVHVIFFIQIQG